MFMLAKTLLSFSDIERPSVWIVEPKLDGMRMGYMNGKAFSRNQKPIYNIDHILRELEELDISDNVMLDGELMASNWEETMSLAKARVTSKPNTALTYVVFDIVLPEQLSLMYRKELLSQFFNHHRFKYIRNIHWEEKKPFDAFYKSCLKAGYEGIMLKHRLSYYEPKRSSHWLKYKPTLTMDCKVIGMKEGKGKYEGTLGSLIVKQENNKICDVSGMTDNLRNWFWQRKHKIEKMGIIIEVEYQSLTPKGIMRFPRYIRLRDDK